MICFYNVKNGKYDNIFEKEYIWAFKVNDRSILSIFKIPVSKYKIRKYDLLSIKRLFFLK